MLAPARSLPAALAALLLSHMAGAEPRTLRHVTYDYSVASYCGLVTPGVEAGFRQELKSLAESRGLSAEEAKAERIAGWADADKEWSNRGLGGFRAWCESEGQAAAAHFLGIAQTLR